MIVGVLAGVAGEDGETLELGEVAGVLGGVPGGEGGVEPEGEAVGEATTGSASWIWYAIVDGHVPVTTTAQNVTAPTEEEGAVHPIPTTDDFNEFNECVRPGQLPMEATLTTLFVWSAPTIGDVKVDDAEDANAPKMKPLKLVVVATMST